MARKFGSIDLQKNDLQNARAHFLAAAPSSPVDGQIYHNSTDHTTYIYDSGLTTWYSTRGTITYGTPGSSAVGDSAAAGSATTLARSDHVHGREGFGAVTAQTTYGASSANGTAVTVAHSDHTHGTPALSANVASTQAIGDSATNGTGTAPAKDDHKHAMPSFGAVTAQTAFGSGSANGSAATLARSDHTHGTPTHDAAAHSTISLSALAAPTADLSIGGFKLTNGATPTASTDFAIKSYVDSVAQGITSVKTPVRVATTANGTLATAYENGDSIDGVTLATGDRILIKNQTTASENGIYTVNASGAPTRATDADASGEIAVGTMVFVTSGTTNGGQQWRVSATGATPWVPGSSTSTWVMYFAATATEAGAGLTATGNVFAVGASTGIVVNADNIAVDRATNGGMVPLKYSTSIGDGTNSAYTITHNLGTLDVGVNVFANSGGAEETYDVVHATTNTVTVTFPFVATSNQYRVVVWG